MLLNKARQAARVGLARGRRALATLTASDAAVAVRRRWKRPAMDEATLKHLLNSSYLCTSAALMLTDVLWVRGVMMVGQSLGMAFNLLQPRPLLLPARWNALFLVFNGYHVAKLLLEKRPLTLTADEAQLYAKAFQPFDVTPREFLRLMEQGEWVRFEPGEVLTRHGEVNTRLLVIDEGVAEVTVGRRLVGKCLPANYVGEMTFMNRTQKAACATVRAATPIKAVAWERAGLRDMLSGDEELMAKVKESITNDVMRKLDKDHDHSTEDTVRTVMRATLAGRTVTPESRRALEAFRGPGFDFDEALRDCGWTADEFQRGERLAVK